MRPLRTRFRTRTRIAPACFQGDPQLAGQLVNFIVNTPDLYRYLKRVDVAMDRLLQVGEYDREGAIAHFRLVADRGAQAFAEAMGVSGEERQMFSDDTLNLVACEFEMNYVLYHATR